jgi:L-amino acid N-acyltransferase YncA
MNVLIRKATPADAPGIVRVHADCWCSTYSGLLPDEFLRELSFERRAAQWGEALRQPDSPSYLFVAIDPGGNLIGFISAGSETEGDPAYRGEVQAIYLVESAQGQGAGRWLMQAAVRELRQRGLPSMLLWVFEDNLGACRFYEALGGSRMLEKPVEIGSRELIEVAYGWSDLSVFPMMEE